jgi:hypothetical protein
VTPLSRIARSAYARASGVAALDGLLGALREHPRVRAFARRHVSVLLERGSTWTNVDGALRLLAEDERQRVAFGPWRGDVASELLYWIPFVRWAQEHFSFDPERLVAISRGGVGHWYADCCAEYVEAPAGNGDAVAFPPEPVLDLVERYRSGDDPPRPLLKRARHRPLPAPEDPLVAGPAQGYVAVELSPSATTPPSTTSQSAAWKAIERLESAATVVRLDSDGGSQPGPTLARIPTERRLRAQHSLVAGAAGLVSGSLGTALVGVLSGVPTVFLRSADDRAAEPDLDLALRVASAHRVSLAVLDAAELASLAAALAGRPEARARGPGR